MTIKSGDKIPAATLYRMGKEGPEGISTDDFFSGRKVVMFGVPGAFTPTCSAQHMPGFVDQIDAFKAKGVDEVACVSVNDVFVMDAWGKDQKAGGKVSVLADGSGEFAGKLGIELDLKNRGLGVRCRRFAMVVDDGVVGHLALEDGGALAVSGADDTLKAL